MKGNPHEKTIAVVGLGLMGSSIAANFLIAGHKVVGLEPMDDEFRRSESRMRQHVASCVELGLVKDGDGDPMDRLHLTQEYADLKTADLVLESVLEDFGVKTEVMRRVEDQVSPECIIASNTSAIPITALQDQLRIPCRFLGLHWAEPAYASNYLEIICGDHTDATMAQSIQVYGANWGKDPVLVRKDIRGFVTNRLMYAVYREGLALLEKGEADLESLDKAFRYDIGSWMTVMGVFQRMDYLGIDHFAGLTKNTFPSLSNSDEVPAVMQKLVREKGRGIHNQNGLYEYTESDASSWRAAFEKFSSDIYQISEEMKSK